ncbi:MAG: conserved rane protein of unknown function [Caulobacteraceae bacterium]|nr:conserved rane protein of unknown function [Caulobacteraceae bacterium]
MKIDTDALIEQLTASAAPVRRLAPPMLRALLWLAGIGLVCGALILRLSNLTVFADRASDPRMALELVATLATGVAGVIAAFHLSLPDRSRAWALLPLPFALAWMGLSGLGCYRDWAEQTRNGWRLGESSSCFVFLLAAGVPMALLLLLSLRRARPLQPRLVAAVGAVGVAALSALALQFFHPFDVTLMDLGAHLAALLILIGVFAVSGRISLAGRA